MISFPLSHFIVHGNSMLPTLKPGQDVLVFNWFINPKVGDLIVFKKDDKEIIKRIKKMEGEEAWVEGDNEKGSTDSRSFGSVHKSHILGKVIWYQYPSKRS